MASWLDELWSDVKDFGSDIADVVLGEEKKRPSAKQAPNEQAKLPKNDARARLGWDQAQPEGLTQAQQRGTRYLEGDDQSQSKFARQAAQWLEGKRAASAAWFTGQNAEGMKVGRDADGFDRVVFMISPKDVDAGEYGMRATVGTTVSTVSRLRIQ